MGKFDDITNKSAFLYSKAVSDRISQFIEPLKSCFGITTFGYIKIFKDGSYLNLNNGYLDYQERYMNSIKTNAGVFGEVSKRVPYSKSYCHIWPTNTANLDPIFSLLYEHNIWHGFQILSKGRDFIEAVSFTFDRSSSDKSEFFLNNLSIFEMFVHHFKNVARDFLDCSNKNKLAIYENGVSPLIFSQPEESVTSKEQVEFLDKISMYKNIKTLGSTAQGFSKRELECLNLIGYGMSIKEIGLSLHLSPRTVESYLENVKQKTGCKYKSDLVKLIYRNKKDIL